MRNKIKKLFIQIFFWIRNQLKKIDTTALSQKLILLFSRYTSWIIVIVTAMALADLALLFMWPTLLPSREIKNSSLPIQASQKKKVSPVDFLHTANIFHTGPIPLSLKESRNEDLLTKRPKGVSQPSNLPFQLLGTIENFNPARSMASIRISSSQPVQSYFVGDEIDGKARVTVIERRHVKFINLINNQLEHIEIPLENELHMMTKTPTKTPVETIVPVKKPKEVKSSIKGISTTDQNKYKVTRSVINEHIADLPNILQQARLEPKINSNGQMIGHEFKWIKKGSVYENLGFKEGDTLISINGEKVSDEIEAQKIFQQFRASSQFSLEIQNKNGDHRELSYNVDENTSIE